MILKYTAGFATELSIIELVPASERTAVMEQLLRDRLQIPGAMTAAKKELQEQAARAPAQGLAW